jgi:mono/diheme cytochrome c family protein
VSRNAATGLVCVAAILLAGWSQPAPQQLQPAEKSSLAASALATSASSRGEKIPEFHAQPSAKRMERGRYLVEGLTHCFHCHSEDNFKDGLGQPFPGKKGAGKVVKDPESPNMVLVIPNITPDKETGAGTWSDAQLERAIRHGIGHDGRDLYSLMPYSNFQDMTDEDLASVIVYLRSIPPVKNVLPTMQLPIPIKVDMHPEIEPPMPASASERVKKGWYLVRMGDCAGCHSAYDEKDCLMKDSMFGGGLRFIGQWGDVTSPNITQHPSGISHYDEAMFIKTIRTGHASGGVRELAGIMPYSYFRNLTDEDLGNIFAFLQTVKPVVHHVDNSEPPTFCRICRQKHGDGDRN